MLDITALAFKSMLEEFGFKFKCMEWNITYLYGVYYLKHTTLHVQFMGYLYIAHSFQFLDLQHEEF